jgi:hypothetical protein
MQIVKIHPADADKKTIYNLTMSPKVKQMRTIKGCRLEINAWVIYEDEDAKTGEVKQILAIQDPEGEVYGTNSATFTEDFLRMVDIFGPDGIDALEIISGTSKAGREFITCAYAGE